MFMKKYSLLVMIIVGLLMVTCKKKNNTVEPEAEPEQPVSQSGSMSFNKSSFRTYEMAEISFTNVTLSDTAYIATVASQSVKAKRINSKLYMCIPDITQATHTVSVIVSGLTYTTSFTKIAPVNIIDPQIYLYAEVDNLIALTSNLQNTLTALSSYTTLTQIPSLQSEITSLFAKLNNLKVQISNLSEIDKIHVATIFSSNKHWLDSARIAVEKLNLMPPPYFKGSVADYFQVTDTDMKVFTLSIINMAACVGITAAAVVAAPTVGSAVVAGLVMGSALGLTEKASEVAMTNLMKNAFKPFESMATFFQKSNNSTLQLIPNNTLKQLVVNGAFRSPYQLDIPSTNTLLNQFNDDTHTLFSSCIKINSMAPQLNLNLPEVLSQKSNFNTYTLSVHSKYLTISDISNPNVTLAEVQRINGELFLKFSTNQITNQQFNFNLNFKSSLGEYTTSISAELGTIPPLDFNYNLTADTIATPLPTGVINVIPSGGLSPYNYNVGGGYQGSNVFFGLTAGTTYTVSVKDAANQIKTKVVVMTGI